MKTNLLKGILVLVVLSGCSSNTTSTAQNNTLQANPTEDPNATATTETVVQELPTADDLEYVEYKYENRYATIYVIGVTNTSDADIRIDANGVAYDAGNNIIGAADNTNACIGAGEKSYLKFYFSDVSGVDHIDYKSGLQIKQDDRFVPVISKLDIQGNVNGDVVTFSATNNGDVAAEYVEVQALFLDANNNVLYEDSKFLTDSNSEIAVGATQVGQINYYNSDGATFDHVDWYVSGRGRATN